MKNKNSNLWYFYLLKMLLSLPNIQKNLQEIDVQLNYANEWLGIQLIIIRFLIIRIFY